MIIGFWSREAPYKLDIIDFITSRHCGNRIFALGSTLETLKNSLAAGRQRPLAADQFFFWRPIEKTKFGLERRV